VRACWLQAAAVVAILLTVFAFITAYSAIINWPSGRSPDGGKDGGKDGGNSGGLDGESDGGRAGGKSTERAARRDRWTEWLASPLVPGRAGRAAWAGLDVWAVTHAVMWAGIGAIAPGHYLGCLLAGEAWELGEYLSGVLAGNSRYWYGRPVLDVWANMCGYVVGSAVAPLVNPLYAPKRP
jgi:hypothetical protein